MKLILVPTDMSETAARALRFASSLAERFDAHLLVLHADTFTPPLDFGTSPMLPVRREEIIESVREQLELHVERNVSPAIPYDARVLAQSTVDAIIEQACDTGADLIVMGTHGRSGISRLLIGSVTEAVIRLATVPVVAVNALSRADADVDAIVATVATTAASYEAQRYAASLNDESVLLHMPGKPSPDQIAHFAKEMNAGLIAVDGNLPSLSTLLHLSPCPVLTINERTVRQPLTTAVL
jgi:universal stress protein A